MTALIRAADEGDDAVIRILLGDAMGPDEAGLVGALREEGVLLDALVACAGSPSAEPVGYGAASRLTVAGGRASCLAPLAVAAEHRHRGIGRRLAAALIERRREAGDDVMLVLGDPAFYGRLGFSAARARSFRTPWDGPHQQAIALSEAGRSLAGAVRYPRAFDGLA